MVFEEARRLAAELFADTYAEARAKFLSSCPNAKAYKSSAVGPSGESLYTDVAYFGASSARKLLVLVSATHGVEGYCGSAAQLLFTHSWLGQPLPETVSVLIIHALNCYGFAWDRRVTFEGCDLNRNFVDFALPVPENRGYETLAEHLVPKDLSQRGLARAQHALDAFREAYGETAYRIARSSGQYTRPGGMFYGGTEPTEARRVLERIAAEFEIGSRDEVVIIDYHSGLGPFGYGEVQCEVSSGPSGFARAASIFGESVTSPDLGTSSSVPLHGTQDEFWERLLGERRTYVCLEFGTYTGGTVLRDDHSLFLYRRNEATSALGLRVRKATKHYYYPQTEDWQEMVAWRCHQVHRQVMEYLPR